MRRRILIAAGVALAAAVAVGAVNVQPSMTISTDPSRSTVISSTDAVVRAAAFVAGAAAVDDLAAAAPVDGAIERFYMVQGRDVMVGVNAHDGHIISLLLKRLLPTGGGVAHGTDDAVATARSFLEGRGLTAAGLTVSVRFLDHGEGSEHVVTWDKVENGVAVPDTMTVGIDATTGSVFRYLRVVRAYAPPPKPAIDEATAVTAAIAASGLQSASAMGTSLRIVFNALGVQALVWEVTLSGPTDGPGTTAGPVIAHAVVDVDSQSGVATVVARG